MSFASSVFLDHQSRKSFRSLKFFRQSLTVFVVTALFIGLGTRSTLAQEYIPIDNELGIYCVYLPDGSATFASAQEGTSALSLSDFEEQRQRVEDFAKRVNARIKTLQKIVRDNKVNNKERKSAIRIIKDLLNARVRAKKKKIAKAIRKKIREIRALEQRYLDVLPLLEDCRNRQLDLGPSAYGANLQFVSFTFEHPDFDVPYYMFGIAVTSTISNPKRSSGEICFSADTPSALGLSSSVRFPEEGTLPVRKEICSRELVGNVVRGFVSCDVTQAGFPANTGLFWVDWAISAGPPSRLSILNFENRVERAGNVYGRPFLKKRGCR